MSSFGTGSPSANSPRGAKSSGWGPSSSLSIRPLWTAVRKEEKVEFLADFPNHRSVLASEVASCVGQVGSDRL
jgi:hypothetical protein